MAPPCINDPFIINKGWNKKEPQCSRPRAAKRRLRELQIRWPGSGRVQVLRDLPMEAVLTIVEGSDDVLVERPTPFAVGG